ncbi:tRNA pseudouridine(38-40) synthase TruA [bacterium]|nr:tRNA pseudouridine(38-40) synthase TruA [bacterium]
MSDNDKSSYRYAIKVEYIGKNYAGSQIQPDRKTVQSELETALSTLIGKFSLTPENSTTNRKIKTIFSGRTDAGVNSRGQIVHFDCTKAIVASKFLYSLNGLLPKDISVSEISEVGFEFHAQKSAKRRYYRYEFFNRRLRNAFDGDIPLYKYPLDIERMQKSLKYLEGEHDFSAFKSAGTPNPATVCFIYNADCSRVGDKVVIDIAGNRFLYNMVRTIVGTLFMLNKDGIPPERMKEILDGRDRAKAGMTVSPYGLTLMKVEY